MTAKTALSAYRKVGASKATGPALAAMYGQLIADTQGGNAGRYIDHLLTLPGDNEITARAKTGSVLIWKCLCRLSFKVGTTPFLGGIL